MGVETPQTLLSKLKANFHDSLFIIGSVLVVTGVAFHSRSAALIVAGGFLLLAPLLELASGFIRGIKGIS